MPWQRISDDDEGTFELQEQRICDRVNLRKLRQQRRAIIEEIEQVVEIPYPENMTTDVKFAIDQENEHRDLHRVALQDQRSILTQKIQYLRDL